MGTLQRLPNDYGITNMNNCIELCGDKYWYLEDDSQRLYTCDVEWIDDQLCINGKLIHREDGPAIEYFDGRKDYLQYGKPHRMGGPAVEYTDGYKAYYENGKQHREDGPAIEYSDGQIEYWLCDKFFKTKEEWEHYRDYLMIME